MTRTITGSLGLVLAFTSIGRVNAQQTLPAPSSSPQAAAPASLMDASRPAMEGNDDRDDKKQMPSLAAPQSAGVAPSIAKGKKGQQEYTGPTTVIELPPTPMLDEEGKQRQDPDG